ncbi:hypothetical protein J4449_00420 [Candidatus Woesearchaeota archaeon]|nr:hypothetical protein [Candidatus Woesearchaeota archaeon]
MSFIRLKKRVTKSKENFYAYIVSNKWHNNLPKQKISLYLGRYHKLDSKIIKIKLSKQENILVYLLKKELLLHNFKQKNHSFIHPKGFVIDLKKNKVLNKQTQNPVCLGLNQGFLCSYTLKNLLKFKPKLNNKKQAAKSLIRILLEAGIKPDKDLFLETFTKLKIL